jgi:hypothetical protein
MKHTKTAHRHFWSRIYTPSETGNNKRRVRISTAPDKWVPVTTARRVLWFRMEETASNMEGNLEYIE